MTKPLESSIVAPARRFVVKERMGPFYKGTKGFVVFYLNTGDSNAVDTRVVITRRGKSGKERLEDTRIVAPVFWIEKDKDFKKHLKENHNRLVRIVTSKEPESLLEMSLIDFMGWATAKVAFLNLISIHGANASFSPHGRLHPLCRVEDNRPRRGRNGLLDVGNVWPKPEENRGLIAAARIFRTYQDDENNVKEQIRDIEDRKRIVDGIRAHEVKLVRRSLSYMLSLTNIEQNAAGWLSVRKGIFSSLKVSVLNQTMKNANDRNDKLQRAIDAKTIKAGRMII